MSIWTARLLNDYDRPEGLRIVREAADMHPQGRVTERDVDKLRAPRRGPAVAGVVRAAASV